MTQETLKKVVELQREKKYVGQAIRELNNGTVILIGSGFRLDKYYELHERVSTAITLELESRLREIEKEIEAL